MTSILPSLPETQSTNAENAASNWRVEAAEALAAAGFERDAHQFLNCGREFFISTCNLDVSHPVDVYPVTCHKRYCPDCEHREASRRLARYIPVLEDIQALDIPGWRLRKIELTTPYRLTDDDAKEKWEKAWNNMTEVLERLFYRLLDHAGRLSRSEKRRKRADWKRHNLAVLVGGEYGPQGLCLHFHLLLYCMYIDQNMLARAWQEVTKGECRIVYIKQIAHNAVTQAIREVAKYVTKIKDLSPSQIPFLANVLRGHRRIRTFGLLQGIGQPAQEMKVCVECGASRRHISILSYFNRCTVQNVAPDEEILANYKSLLNLKHGNKSGEKIAIQERAIPPPD